MTDEYDFGLDFGQLDFGNSLSEPPVDVSFMEGLKEIDLEIATLQENAKKQARWHTGKGYKEPLCDLKDHMQLHRRKFGYYVSSFKKTPSGYPLAEIKHPGNVRLFALKACEIVCGMVRLRKKEGWCIITTPRRRHKENHFATMVCQIMSERLGIPFYPDVLEARNRQRINATYDVVREVTEPNIIIYDDILTTGSTMEASVKCFADRNIISIIGITN